jgi:hypothetical protein
MKGTDDDNDDDVVVVGVWLRGACGERCTDRDVLRFAERVLADDEMDDEAVDMGRDDAPRPRAGDVPIMAEKEEAVDDGDDDDVSFFSEGMLVGCDTGIDDGLIIELVAATTDIDADAGDGNFIAHDEDDNADDDDDDDTDEDTDDAYLASSSIESRRPIASSIDES